MLQELLPAYESRLNGRCFESVGRSDLVGEWKESIQKYEEMNVVLEEEKSD